MLRWFESNPAQFKIFQKNYKNDICCTYRPTIFRIVKYNNNINVKIDNNNTILNLGTLNKFFKGAKITKSKPIKLLIKKRG